MLSDPGWLSQPLLLPQPLQIIFAVGVQCQRPALPKGCPAAMERLVTACWADEPSERPAFKEVLLSLQVWHGTIQPMKPACSGLHCYVHMPCRSLTITQIYVAASSQE